MPQGKKIEPAWSKFVRGEKNPDNRDYAGWMFYNSVSTTSSPWAVAVIEELMQHVRVHVIFIMAGLLLLASSLFTVFSYVCIRLFRMYQASKRRQQEKRQAIKHNIWIH